MRIFENIIFVFIQIILIIFLFLMNARIVKNIGKSKIIGIIQMLLVNGFSLFTLYQSYIGLKLSEINKIDLSQTWNQIIVAIMIVCGIIYSIYASRFTATELIEGNKENLTATMLSNGFVLIVLMAIAFSVEWELKWIL